MTSVTAEKIDLSAALRRARRSLDDAGVRITGKRVLALCSGGVDSTILVDLLHRLPTGARPASVVVLWCDHGLQNGIDSRACARETASRHQAEFVERSADGALAGPGNIQSRARAWRYATALDVAREHGCTFIATGHTADDQLETVLLSLVGDAGKPGAGMAVVRSTEEPAVNLVRPLLSLARSEIEAWAVAEEISWWEDPSNGTDRFRRNHLRHSAVPALLEQFPDAAAIVGRRAAAVRRSESIVDAYAEIISSQACIGGVIDVEYTAKLPSVIRRDVVGRWLAQRVHSRDVSDRLIAAVERMLLLPGVGPQGARISCVGGTIRRNQYDLHFEPDSASAHNDEQ
jgi:tRNA(Ile)-lysidine synthase